MAAAPASSISARTALGALSAELDVLRDEAIQLFTSYENDESVNDLAERATVLGQRAYRISAALSGIGDGLAQL